jgi:hypothetical protein
MFGLVHPIAFRGKSTSTRKKYNAVKFGFVFTKSTRVIVEKVKDNMTNWELSNYTTYTRAVDAASQDGTTFKLALSLDIRDF